MTTSGAYENEMGRFLRLSDEELSRLLAGEAGVRDEAFDEVASILEAVRETYAAASPSDETRALHLAAISDAAQLAADEGNPVARPASSGYRPVELQASELPKWRRVMQKSIGFAVKVVAATVAASMSMVGLAYAGVDLPGQAAERAFEAVTGLELPNQGSDEEKSVADEVRSVVDSDLEGCERGQAVADAADANRQDDATTETDPCDKAGDGRAKGEEKSAAGRAKAAEKSGGRSESRGSDAGTTGRATAAEKSGGASDAGADNAGTNDDAGQAKAGEASSTGPSTADGASEKGTTTADEASSSGKGIGSTASEDAQSKNPTGKGAP
jgi:hypothetical protein